jgi:hypothetical protein
VPGAGAEDVASQVTVPVERAVVNIPRLETVQSTSGNSLSLVFAQFEFGTDVDEKLSQRGLLARTNPAFEQDDRPLAMHDLRGLQARQSVLQHGKRCSRIAVERLPPFKFR